MKAIVINENKELVWGEAADPACAADEVLVKVHATAINRADLLQASGNYPPPAGASEILGLEMAGEVVAMGDEVTEWQIGDRVCALLPGGGYAALVNVPAKMLLPIPENWSYAEAAAIPEVWLTAFVNLFWEGDLKPKEIALIHAGGSGVGTAAVQLITAVGGQAFVTAGTEAKLEKCRHLGATLAINYKETDFLPAVMEATNNNGVDLILDPVGANYLDRNLQALARFGRLVSIGLLSGGKTEMNMAPILRKRLKIIGSTLRTRPVAEKIALTQAFKERFWADFLDGTLVPIIDCTFPIAEANAAHQYIAGNKNIGKVILLV
jgi:putative PIG3 family NAD(P)H quinone oxidoreductase